MKIFDSHFHIINPKFPLVKNNGYLPPNFTIENYQEKTIVSGSFQKFDQNYLVESLKKPRKNYFRVANISIGMNKRVLKRLSNSNIVLNLILNEVVPSE
jgi:predicted TIM-barrel fold metal-dependent hydrolase